MAFKKFNLQPELLRAVEESGYNHPTPIQDEAIPHILEGRDLQASAQTGTGKTAAFILPTLNLLAARTKEKWHGPRALILAPTRELAMQVASQAAKYSKHLPRIKTICIYGGEPYPVQKRKLAKPYDLLVATPGRLMDHMEQGKIDLSQIEIFILDEADRMLDMGFIDAVKDISSQLPEERQTLLFSATLKGSILKLSSGLLKNPKQIKVEEEKGTNENIEQKFHYAQNLSGKNDLLNALLEDEEMSQVIVFTATKSYAEELTDKLNESGHNAVALHGDMNQSKRNKVVARLRQERVRVLVATDVAARGIDISSITHVVNFDLPTNVEDYVHRIGRTGRAGKKGSSITFVTQKDIGTLKKIEAYTGQKVEQFTIPGMECHFSETKGSRGNERRQGRGAPRGGQQGRFKRSSQGEGRSFKPFREERRPFQRPQHDSSFNEAALSEETFSDKKPRGKVFDSFRESEAPFQKREKRPFSPFRNKEREPSSFNKGSFSPRQEKPFHEREKTSRFEGRKTFGKPFPRERQEEGRKTFKTRSGFNPNEAPKRFAKSRDRDF